MKCAECHTVFICRADTKCWCFDLPKIISPDLSSCLCYDCLILKIALQINQNTSNINEETRAKIKALGTSDKLINKIDYTIEKIEGEDKYVFSTWYLLKRGYCCDNNCRNCPYPK